MNIHRLFLPLLYVCLLGLCILSCGDEPEETPEPETSNQPAPSHDSEKDEAIATSPTLPPPASTDQLELVPQKIRLVEPRHLLKETEFTLNIPKGFEIAVAAEGMQRVRFMAMSPDNRLFITDMHDLSDNRQGKIYILENFNVATRRFTKKTTYLNNLRNPNNVAFHTDSKGQTWLYTAVTDALLRYRYRDGDAMSQAEPDTLATFPDDGKSYREGGWHLTRTVTFGDNGKLYVSVGSSCNACEEKEKIRAVILEMKPDGSDQHIYAQGLRNAVGIRWIKGALWATNMGADHLGLDKPEDNFYRIKSGGHYGWPYTYEYQKKIYADPVYGTEKKAVLPESVDTSWAGFLAHSSPLGFDWFGNATDRSLNNVFLVALHGSGSVAMKRGYSIVRLGNHKVLGDFVNGFLKDGKRYGRPCDVLRVGENNFFFSDDYAGVIYFVYRGEESNQGIRDV